MLAGDFRKLAALLKDKDAKIRKNAALILGELESEDVLPWLYEAYEKEKQLFVRESYLKAMEKLNFSQMLPKLKKRQKTLQEELLYAADEGKKHLQKEAAVLSRMILKYEKPKHHTFCGGKTEDVILLCNRNNRQITARQIQTGEVSMLAGGVRIQGGRSAGNRENTNLAGAPISASRKSGTGVYGGGGGTDGMEHRDHGTASKSA